MIYLEKIDIFQTDFSILNAQKLFHKWEVEILPNNSLKSLFLWTETTVAIFHSLGNFPCLMQDLKISSSGSQIALPHIFNMQMLIIL